MVWVAFRAIPLNPFQSVSKTDQRIPRRRDQTPSLDLPAQIDSASSVYCVGFRILTSPSCATDATSSPARE